MQGLTIDTLASKHIPATSIMSSLRHLVTEFATHALRESDGSHAALASAPAAKMVTSHSAVSVVPASTLEQERVYSGSMAVGGSLSATSNQTGTWSGTLQNTVYLTVDSSGDGSGYETFSGDVTLSVTNPDGSHKSSTSLLAFYTPEFNLQHGKFSFSQSSGFDFSGLYLTLNLGGSFSKSQATLSNNLGLPFSGSVNGVIVSGSINGKDTVTDKIPLLVSGTAERQTAYAATKMAPFKTLAITDLNSTTVTATVILSNPAHGTLSDAAGGTYNRATGTYSFTGGAPAVNHALNALAFDPTGTTTGRVPTIFTLRITDAKGASLTSRATSVIAVNPLSIRGVTYESIKAGDTTLPFHRITIGDALGAKSDTIKITLSNPAAGKFEDLLGGHYNQKTGVYVLQANAASATFALHELQFQTSGAGITEFTILVKNAAGATVTNSKTTIVAKKAGPAITPATDVALFSQYVAAGLHGAVHHAAALPAPHALHMAAHLELAGAHR